MYSTINLTLEISSVVVLLVLIACQLSMNDRDARVNRLFLAVLFLLTATLITDTFAWGFNGAPGVFSLALTRVSNFLTYTFGISLSVAYTAYISESIPLDSYPSKITINTVTALAAVFMIAIIVSQSNGMVYSVDGSNHFHWGDYYWLPHVLSMAQCVFITIAILRCRKKLPVRDAITYLIYALIPTISFLFNLVFYRLMLTYFTMTLGMLIIFVNIQMQREKIMREQEYLLRDQQITMMFSQIQPHFLYNSLTAIGKLCDIDPARAKEAVNDFAHYMRGNLESLGQRGLISFEDELEHVETYLALEQLRFGEKLKVAYHIETEEFVLPPLTVQPIVENAVRHGALKAKPDGSAGGTVTVAARERENGYEITVTDDGVGFDPAQPMADGREHIGIENVRGRLAAICDGELLIESTPGAGTNVTIRIPKH